MSNYTSNGLLFRYTISNSSSYVMTADDYTIIQDSFDKWDSLVQPNPRFTNGYTIDVSFNISTLGTGILGGAQVLTAYYFGTYTFGNAYTAHGKITMNSTYLNTLKTSIRTDGKSSFYHVMLHEIGHILGIGTYWNMSGSPVIGYLDGSETKYYYTGEHAVREYKSYIPEIQDTIVGLPIEDNGGSGTQNVHPEEGEEGTASSDNRYINGYFHPGLDNELMSGWMESYPDSTPLSRITLGFLEDMGFIVNYNQVDDYQIILNQNYVSSVYNMSNWLDLSSNANTFKSSYVQGFLDINGGNIRTRNPTDHLMIAGDASLNRNLYVGGDISWNPSNIANDSIPLTAIIGGGPTGPQGELGPTGPQGVTGPSADTADTLTLSKASGDGLVVLADTSLNNDLRVAGDTSMNGTLVVSGETTIGLLNTSTIINGGTISAMTYSIGGQGVISGSRQFTGTDLELKNNNGDSKLIITGETGIAQIDTINEITANAGVTIESVELKDNTITAHTIEATNYSVGSVNFVSATRQGNFRDLEVKSGSNVVTVLIDGDTGNTTIDGRLDTTDASFSKISTTGTADFNGLSTFNNGLTVTSGSVTLPNSSIPSSAIIGGGPTGPQGDKGDIGATGPTGFFDTSNDVTLGNRLFVANDVSLNSNLYIKEKLTIGPTTLLIEDTQINGLTSGENSGFSVSINDDGTIVAIGAFGYNSNIGTTRIYEWNGSAWVLKGNQIDGLTTTDRSGYSVSISSDGTVVAIGAYYFIGGAGGNSGTTRIYEWSGTAWVLKGSQIDGLTSGERSGYSVSINSDGTVVAIGAYYFSGGAGGYSGTTYIYEWSGTAWLLRGSQINGLTSGEFSGVSVSLNSDGTVVAIGAITFSGGAGGNSGTTRIYEWSGTAWVLKGSQINGLTSGENSGISVSINSTGTVVAIGAYNFSGGAAGTSGTTRIYEWSGTAWVLKGSQIDGLTSGERSGHSVSISSDGTVVAIGAYKNNLNTGTTRIYEWNGTAWTLKKQINGLTSGENSGRSVSMNSDGTVVGIGAFEYNSNTGTTYVYNVSDPIPPGHLYVGGDSSLNGQLYVSGSITGTLATASQPNITTVGTLTNLYVDGDISWNPNSIPTASIPSEAVIGGGTGPTGPSADINSIIQTDTFSVTAVKNNEQNNGSNTSVTLNDTGYYYKIGKMVHVSYPRLTKTLLSMTANETLISLSLPFTCDKIASRVCAGQGVSGVFSGISMTGGLPTMIATSGNNSLECKYFTESNVDAVILFNSSSDYVDVTFDYISQ